MKFLKIEKDLKGRIKIYCFKCKIFSYNPKKSKIARAIIKLFNTIIPPTYTNAKLLSITNNTRELTCRNIIVTRYYINLGNSENSQPHLQNFNSIYDYLEKRTEIFKSICYNSVISQMNEDDIWFLLISEDLKPFLQCKIPEDKRVCLATVNEYFLKIKELFKQNDKKYITSTRIDNDDSLACDYLLKIKETIQYTGANNGVIVFPYGVQYSKKYNKLYNNKHTCPHFITTFTNYSDEKYLNVFNTGNHTQIYNSNFNIFAVETNLPMWLEYIHESNIINSDSQTKKTNEILCNMNEMLQKRFLWNQ